MSVASTVVTYIHDCAVQFKTSHLADIPFLF